MKTEKLTPKQHHEDLKERILHRIIIGTYRSWCGAYMGSVKRLSVFAGCSETTTRNILKELADEKRILIDSVLNTRRQKITLYRAI